MTVNPLAEADAVCAKCGTPMDRPAEKDSVATVADDDWAHVARQVAADIAAGRVYLADAITAATRSASVLATTVAGADGWEIAVCEHAGDAADHLRAGLRELRAALRAMSTPDDPAL